MVADRGEALQTTFRQAGDAQLDLQVRDDRRQVAVARALAQPVERALDVTAAGAHRSHRVGDRAARVVVAVDADDHVVADMAVHVAHDGLDLVGQRAAVGVAQHHMAGALHDGGFQRPQAELRVGLVAVEEMLQVDHHHAPSGVQELDRVGDHQLAFLQRGLQRLGDLIVPTLGHDAHRARVRVEQVAQGRVVVGLAAGTACAAERDHRRRGQPQLRVRAGEELDVLRVGARPAALDVVHAEVVELLGNAQLVVDRGRHAFHLQAVAQGGVEHFDGAGFRVHRGAF